jgi:hypothetical protein
MVRQVVLITGTTNASYKTFHATMAAERIEATTLNKRAPQRGADAATPTLTQTNLVPSWCVANHGSK